MGEKMKCAPPLSKETGVLDVKPLRTLSPMFPASLGLNAVSPPASWPFVFVTPHGSFTSGNEVLFPSNFCSLYPSFCPNGMDKKSIKSSQVKKTNGSVHDGAGKNGNGPSHDTVLAPCPLRAMPVITVLSDNDEDLLLNDGLSTSDVKIEQPVPLGSCPVGGGEIEGSDMKKPKRKRFKKAQDPELMMLPSSSYDARESVEAILMTFDALRRRLLQLEEVKDVNKRSVTKAGTIMMDHDLRANNVKRIGHVPGIEVGDLFYFRIEMCLVGLHAQSVSGIDYMTARFGDEDDPVAVAVVSAGGYENDDEDADVLIYTGQGGSGKNDKKQIDDQKLERGNLALERSLHRGNEIRVIRTAKDVSSPGSKIYIYDGLYKINKSWVEKAKSGFNVFKYKLVREPGQPDGIVTWKMIERWRKDPSLRGKVILPDMSSGDEKLPVCLVNDVDDEKGPSHFTYTTKLHVSSSISKTLHGCMCHNVCLPGDANCSCVLLNGGDLPYTSNGLLVSHKPLIYECGTSCQCTPSCRNRLTQNGITHRFEVFRTKDRGWGLRSWDPIRAGAFICEYTGEVIDKGREDEDGENEYIFQPTNTDDNAFSWNYIPELLGEPSHPDSSDTIKPLQIIISAKNMGNISRFMNHSCSPNVFWQAVQRDNGDEGYPHIVFFAIRHIPPMTELTYDYGPCGDEIVKEDVPNSDRSRRPKKCLCKSPKCRGVFR
ncbi:hypothetical protein J5N97_014517 [Dioscorea zingiberensis]|uniref:Uncharacterized protein n=1 Tax=Dioscorea zingiberensis TaxID=325984 RepID=A0A9D5CVC1_9LILI|nr:hypothetical protein J5N97_014517 [Dioscorea zingiberensis]